MNDISAYSKVIFLGGGVMAQRLYRQIHGIENKLIGVMDLYEPQDRKRTEFMGLTIQSPKELEAEIMSNDTAVMVAIGSPYIGTILNEYMQKYRHQKDHMFLVNPYSSLRFFCIDDGFAGEERVPFTDEKYKIVEKLFTDNESCSIFKQLVTAKPYETVEDSYEIVPYSLLEEMFYYKEDYWDSFEFPDTAAANEATVLDCGAYIGDSIEQICRSIPQKEVNYYAFEPLLENAESIKKNESLKKICSRLNVYQFGVGSEDTQMVFQMPVTGDKEGGRFVEDKNSAAADCLEIRSLDGLNLDIKGQLYIKMDIEGAELGALKGAERLIKSHKPYLAVCLYHRKNDLLEIPMYLHHLMPDYKFYLRGGYHTILWAVPE